MNKQNVPFSHSKTTLRAPVSVGVVITVYNRPTLVLETLDTVLAQSHEPSRVVIVDDGSTDETVRSVREWMTENNAPPTWQLIEAPHNGAVEAKNAGLAAVAECGRVVVLDSDDLWPADFLARAHEALSRDPDLIGVTSDRLMTDGEKNTAERHDLSVLTRDPFTWAILNGLGIGSCTVLSARAVREAGGFPVEAISGHDTVLLTKLFALGPWGHLTGEPVTFRRNHAKKYGEADHIFRSVHNVNANWAAHYDVIYDRLRRTGRATLRVRRAMARRWLSAAKVSFRDGNTTDGRGYLKKSRAYWPYSLQHLKWSLRFAMKG